jgi:hypothetical protein
MIYTSSTHCAALGLGDARTSGLLKIFVIHHIFTIRLSVSLLLSRASSHQGAHLHRLPHVILPPLVYFLYGKALTMNVLPLDISIFLSGGRLIPLGRISVALICNQGTVPTQGTIVRFLTLQCLLPELPVSCNTRSWPLSLWRCSG